MLSPRLLHPARLSPLIVGLTVGVTACRGREPRTPSDSTAATSVAGGDSAASRRSASGWNAAAGPALLVQGATRDEAIVLWPTADDSTSVLELDSASTHGVPVILLGRGGARIDARIGSPSGEATDDCERWPLRVSAGAGAWSVGFVGRQVASMPLDSVDVLSPRDSMLLVAEASRLASAVTAPTSASFQGLRFTAHDIRRFRPTAGVDALVAHLVRRVNQEANPQEEQTLLVAERDSGVTSGPYRLVYAERTFGREEAVSTPEVLAGLHLGSPSATLLVARDSDDGVTYSFLERIGPRQWRRGWVSPVTRCG